VIVVNTAIDIKYDQWKQSGEGSFVPNLVK
jgi:hypothetical protein